MKQIIGRKMGMTEVFAKDGTMYAVTVIEVLPNVVTQVKTLEKDGYEALQVGFEEKKESRANKAEKGHFAKAGVPVLQMTWPRSICSRKRGITEPLEPRTLPKRVVTNFVRPFTLPVSMALPRLWT